MFDRGFDTTHKVLKLTLRSGQEVVVDRSGAQYCLHDPVMFWSEYKRLRVRHIDEITEPPASHR